MCDHHIQEVIESEANKQGLQISKSRLSELQPLAGRNPMLARKIIKDEALGLKHKRTHLVCGHHAHHYRCADGFWYRAVCRDGNW